MERDKNNINFNLTPEQQEKFNLIYKETKELYPHLVGDDVSKQRIKVLIAYTVVNDDAKINFVKEELENDVDGLEKIFHNNRIELDGE